MIFIILLSTGIGWMARLAEISVGIGLGLHIPSQQLMVAETALPHQRYVYFTVHCIIKRPSINQWSKVEEISKTQ